MKVLTRFQGELLKEYKRTQKQLRIQLKRKNTPEIVKAIIEESINALTERQAVIIARYVYLEYKKGIADAKRELKGVNIEGAAPIPDMGGVGMKLDEVSQQQMNRIFHTHLGKIGDYNINLSKTHQAQYNLLLNDNKLLKNLNQNGWTPWLEKEWEKRGIDPSVIKLVKGQKTSKQMVNILESYGIKGGKHPNEVAKMLIPHVNRFFGPEGVVINNVGKSVNRLIVDADGNFEYVRKKVTKVYKATPQTYSRLIARDTLRRTRMDAYYDSLAKSKLVDHYISIAHMDSTTCGICATMHGKTVTKGSGPLFHGNCGCDLRPVWKKDSPLASQNKPEAFFENQRNRHFLRMHDLKRYNAKMPRGMKLKYATQLPEDDITKVIPGKIKIRAIRHEMLGKPKSLVPIKPIEKVVTHVPKKDWGMSDKAWKREAKTLYAKTAKDGKEHLKLMNGKFKEVTGTKNSVKFEIPKTDYLSLHTHPGWDSPLSGGDIFSFLTSRKEQVGAATSYKSIYLIQKTANTKMVPNTTPSYKIINDLFAMERRKILKLYGPGPYTDAQQTQAALTAGKVLAENHSFEYKVIPV
jgi:hypothetical protein